MAEKLKQMHWKKILLVGGILMVALVAGLCVQKPEGIKPTPLQPAEELKLSDFPEAFKDSTLIIVGDNTSDIEMQAANEIAEYLENETGNKPLIKKYSEITEEDKRNYNLIVVGTPKTNPFLKEVYALTNATKVTEEFPGEGRGVLEILRNPWDEEKAMLLVEGSDKWGARVGSLMIVEENKKLTKERKFVDWIEYTGEEFPIDSEEEAIRYAKTDPGVRNFISAWTAKKGCRVISQVILHEPDEGLFGVGFGVRCFGEPVFDAGYEIRFKDNGEIVLSVYRSI